MVPDEYDMDDDGYVLLHTPKHLDQFAKEGGWDNGMHFLKAMGTSWPKIKGRRFTTIRNSLLFKGDDSPLTSHFQGRKQ